MTEGILANGLPYSKKLSAHTSCVNALACSTGDGRFLASGGDDLRIKLWDFHQEEIQEPFWTFTGPRGNVFSIAWSATNRFLYSGGTDQLILKYDVSSMSSSLSVPGSGSFIESDRTHEGSVREISCHPEHDELFFSASDDGRIVLHDSRADTSRTRAQSSLQLSAEVTGVQSHPRMEHLFATSDSYGGVCLRDARMAFGPLKQRTNSGVVQTYNTKLSKQSVSHISNPEASSISFDTEGTKLAVTLLHYYPTIYSLSDSQPIATCSGRNLPSGEPVPPGQRTYSNSCTIKHGSFGSLGLNSDDYYSAGSDDFRAYVWKVNNVSELAERRKHISADDWGSQEFPNVIAFAEGTWEPRYVPVELSTPLCRLSGHQSIVNTTLIHPHLLHIITSGVERDILLHSPTMSSPCSQNMALTDTETRQIAEARPLDHTRLMRALASPLTLGDDSAEDEVLEMFDCILREEGDADVFATRRLEEDSSSDSDLE